MKNQTQKNWIWQTLVATAFFVTVGLNSAYAESPFQDGDFVSIPELDGLEVQKHEITYDQWNALNSQLPSVHQNPWEAICFGKDYIADGFGPNYPAACISFYDAKAYIRALNAQDPNYYYRLPYEKELILLVARSIHADYLNVKVAITEHKKIPIYANFNYFDDMPGLTHAREVCQKMPLFGLCDILGNVYEWTELDLIKERGNKTYIVDHEKMPFRYVHGGSFLSSSSDFHLQYNDLGLAYKIARRMRTVGTMSNSKKYFERSAINGFRLVREPK